MSAIHSKRAKAYALLLINTALWGFSAPIIKYSLDFVSPNEFLLSRYLLASLIFLPVYLITRPRNTHPQKNKPKRLTIIFLALLGTPLTLIPLYEGLRLTSSLEASILTATGPLTTILAGWLFLKEKISKNEKLGITITLIGTTLVTVGPLLNGQQETSSVIGSLLIILSNLIWTVFLIFSKRLKINASLLSLTSYLVSIPVFASLVSIQSPPSNIPLTQILMSGALPGILYMAIFGSIIAFWTYMKGQEEVEASEAAVFTYLQPIFAFPLAFFWLKEPITWDLLLGSLVISLGVYLSEKHK